MNEFYKAKRSIPCGVYFAGWCFVALFLLYVVNRKFPDYLNYAFIGIGVGLLWSVLTYIRGYRIRDKYLEICYLLWSWKIPVHDLRKIRLDPQAGVLSFPIFGNPGIGSWVGCFYSKEVGIFQGYYTDYLTMVVITTRSRLIAVSPEDPYSFLQVMRDASRPPDRKPS